MMISVIVPVYNVEKYLEKCIKSLINQTYRNIEIILVDDGSSDGCAQICDVYALKDERIIVIHQPNKGVSTARNVGLDLAKGDYIGFVDPDDWVAPEMYEDMLSAMIRLGGDLAICGYNYYNEDNCVDETRRYSIRENEIIMQKEVMRRFFDMPPTIRHGVVNKLFKKNVLQGQFFDVKLHSSEDVSFLNEYVLKITKAVIVHHPYYKNLVREGSATHGGLKIDSLADSFSAHNQMYCDAVRLYPELKNHALAFLLDVCTLKYKEAKRKQGQLPKSEIYEAEKRLREMKAYIKNYAWHGLLNREIYWKTRIMYLIQK